MRVALGFVILGAISCNRQSENSNETVAFGKVLSADTGKFDDPASYTVAIGTEKEIYCSGTLIHPKIALTAGHCDVKPSELVAKVDSQGK